MYRTGDVARYMDDGAIEYIGRTDFQVKLRGFRIELGEIEAVLSTAAGVSQAVVLLREDTPGDKRLVAYLSGTAEMRASGEAAAREHARQHLPEHMVPSHFVFLDAVPLTPSGKVDRKALRAPMPVNAPAAAQSEAAMTPAQRRVAAIWREILNLESVGLQQNFFDVGGQSLLLVRLHEALSREFGTAVPFVEMFQCTTVASQAERFTGVQPAGNDALQRARARAARQQHD
jgi:hypothetical protein